MDEFETDDIDLSAYLIARGHQLARIRPPDTDGYATFVFRESSGLGQDVKDWQRRYAEPVTADAAVLLDTRRDLYRRIREVQE